ncbi:hypothetical protein [Saccharothrix yanglingensis]|uniref:Uncharacterized protein n=1 Tax=Saccharothrix yanglingensis TaxID=659496 RepID=A0ABU0X8S2_9PSEU|nr:hypothetical protein [Saccharothrix yanglingensis]MDQ2587014.1 hypothetical protein [Saccharothrix yanglingensis]
MTDLSGSGATAPTLLCFGVVSLVPAWTGHWPVALALGVLATTWRPDLVGAAVSAVLAATALTAAVLPTDLPPLSDGPAALVLGLVLLSVAAVLWRRHDLGVAALPVAVAGTTALAQALPSATPFILVAVVLLGLAAESGDNLLASAATAYAVTACASVALLLPAAVPAAAAFLGAAGAAWRHVASRHEHPRHPGAHPRG